MDKTLPHRTSPRKETLDYIRAFARFYQPQDGAETLQEGLFFPHQPTAVC